MQGEIEKEPSLIAVEFLFGVPVFHRGRQFQIVQGVYGYEGALGQADTVLGSVTWTQRG